MTDRTLRISARMAEEIQQWASDELSQWPRDTAYAADLENLLSQLTAAAPAPDAVARLVEAARAENERLQTIIDNLHAVEQKHRETANAEFHRANRLQVENERLRKALSKINVGDGWAAQIARAALAQKGGE